MTLTFSKCVELLGEKSEYKLGPNCHVVKRDNRTIAVRLYATDIITFYLDGNVKFDHAGHKTRTTFRHWEKYSPFPVSTDGKGNWQICRTVLHGNPTVFNSFGELVG
jgi:hypothetical protein